MIVNITVGSREEADGHIDTALAAGVYPITNCTGVMLVQEREMAIVVFHAIVEKLARKLDQELVIYFCRDGKGRDCLSVMPNQPQGVQIYGVTAEEFDFPDMRQIKRDIH